MRSIRTRSQGRASAEMSSADGRMGGLLIADAARDIARNTREGDPLWPHIVGVLGMSPVPLPTPFISIVE